MGSALMPAVILSAFYLNGRISLGEADRGCLLMDEHSRRVFRCHNVLFCVFCRLVGRAQTSLRRHGELGAERVRGAEDPIGR